MDLIITVSHNCIAPQSEDANCDLNSRQFATFLHKRLGGCLILSDNLRRESDNNRSSAREVTNMRRNLSRKMKLCAPNFLVVDLHTFTDEFSDKDVVILDTYLSRESFVVLQELLSVGINAAIIAGKDNDIQLEAREWGGACVLIELHQNLDERVLWDVLRAIELLLDAQ